jgi:heme-degrading monooxygenase HmoA
MSVMMLMKVKADPAKLEEVSKANPERMTSILEHAKEHGAIHHRFFGGDGEVVVIDEWETQEGFQAFFGHDEQVAQLMQDAGVTSEPEISFYSPLDTGDEL